MKKSKKEVQVHERSQLDTHCCITLIMTFEPTHLGRTIREKLFILAQIKYLARRVG